MLSLIQVEQVQAEQHDIGGEQGRRPGRAHEASGRAEYPWIEGHSLPLIRKGFESLIGPRPYFPAGGNRLLRAAARPFKFDEFPTISRRSDQPKSHGRSTIAPWSPMASKTDFLFYIKFNWLVLYFHLISHEEILRLKGAFSNNFNSLGAINW